jgi:hypothetical protein
LRKSSTAFSIRVFAAAMASFGVPNVVMIESSVFSSQYAAKKF